VPITSIGLFLHADLDKPHLAHDSPQRRDDERRGEVLTVLVQLQYYRPVRDTCQSEQAGVGQP
jgi:hypothetical protein